MMTKDEIEILETLSRKGWVLVPRVPTEVMLKEAWAEAHEEDAAGVWREMVQAGEIKAEEIQPAEGGASLA